MPSIATIMRHEAQLRQAAGMLSQANSVIESAKKGCEAAATQLAANWEGSARDAFVAEQIKAKSWLEQMIQIIREISSTIDKINSKYTDVEHTVSSLIKNK